MIEQLVTQYLAQLYAIQQTGAAQPEQSYYPALQTLLVQAAQIMGRGEAQAILQPQHEDYGVPDFQVQQEQTIIGWTEAKRIDRALNINTQQIRKYRSALHNLMVTNYLHFRLFINNESMGDVTLAASVISQPTQDAITEFEQLLDLFFRQSAPAIQSASQLADALALRARFLRQAVIELYEASSQPLISLHNAYTNYLFPHIDDGDFFDVVAQTIVYALFAAWSQTPRGQFSLNAAATHLPSNVPLLQNLFSLTVNNPALQNTKIGLHVAGLVNLLAQTDPLVLRGDIDEAEEAMQDDVGEDPVMYFYQPFLHSYSPRTAKARGVYYTPLAAVRTMVCIADSVANDSFGRQKGLADQNVFLLDPATGTGTFLAQIARQIKANVEAAGDHDLLQRYLRERFLTNSYGFEFLAAPYIIAHLKLTRILQDEFNFAFEEDERLKVYLTNTLQNPDVVAPVLT
jgi:type I restriction-modification system DNA methylase subunit